MPLKAPLAIVRMGRTSAGVGLTQAADDKTAKARRVDDKTFTRRCSSQNLLFSNAKSGLGSGQSRFTGNSARAVSKTLVRRFRAIDLAPADGQEPDVSQNARFVFGNNWI